MDRLTGVVCMTSGREPRARGDGPDLLKDHTYNPKRAPRTRGWTGVVRTDTLRTPESPAHAGMDRSSVRSLVLVLREPRARGDGPPDDDPAHSGQRRAPRMRGWTEAAYRLEYLTSESLADVEMGRTGVTEDALLIIGEVTTNALLRTPHPGGCGAFLVLVFFCPYCLWGVCPLCWCRADSRTVPACHTIHL